MTKTKYTKIMIAMCGMVLGVGPEANPLSSSIADTSAQSTQVALSYPPIPAHKTLGTCKDNNEPKVPFLELLSLEVILAHISEFIMPQSLIVAFFSDSKNKSKHNNPLCVLYEVLDRRYAIMNTSHIADLTKDVEIDDKKELSKIWENWAESFKKAIGIANLEQNQFAIKRGDKPLIKKSIGFQTQRGAKFEYPGNFDKNYEFAYALEQFNLYLIFHYADRKWSLYKHKAILAIHTFWYLFSGYVDGINFQVRLNIQNLVFEIGLTEIWAFRLTEMLGSDSYRPVVIGNEKQYKLLNVGRAPNNDLQLTLQDPSGTTTISISLREMKNSTNC